MANVKVSAMSPLPSGSATFTYGITNTNTEGKVAVGGNDGLPYNDGIGVLRGTTVAYGATVTTGFAPLYAPLFNGDVKLVDVGGGLFIKEGTNACMGILTLNGATEVTVSTNQVTPLSRIFLTVQSPAGTPAGVAYVSSRSSGVSFGVKGIALDTSTVAWIIIEPA